MKCKKCGTELSNDDVITYVRKDKIEIEVDCYNPECNAEYFCIVTNEDLAEDDDD